MADYHPPLAVSHGLDSCMGSDTADEDDSESNPIEYFPGAAQAFQGGSTFLNKFAADEFSNHRSSNTYYPFASRGDWQMGSWLLRSGLSMSAINTFLSLDLVYFFVD